MACLYNYGTMTCETPYQVPGYGYQLQHPTYRPAAMFPTVGSYSSPGEVYSPVVFSSVVPSSCMSPTGMPSFYTDWNQFLCTPPLGHHQTRGPVDRAPTFAANALESSSAAFVTSPVFIPYTPQHQTTNPRSPYTPESGYASSTSPVSAPSMCGSVPSKRSTTRRRRLLKKCPECGKEFAQRSTLNFHLRAVHGTGTRSITELTCQICHKVFTHPASLRTHLRKHTGETPYKCQHCPKAFGDASSARRHERTHDGERPYTCGCGVSFSQSSNLRRHQRNVHGPAAVAHFTVMC